MPAERHSLAAGPPRHPDGEQGDHEAGEVSEKVRGIGGDGEAVRKDPTHHLGDHEDEAEH